jgi:hypothetical protein
MSSRIRDLEQKQCSNGSRRLLLQKSLFFSAFGLSELPNIWELPLILQIHQQPSNTELWDSWGALERMQGAPRGT